MSKQREEFEDWCYEQTKAGRGYGMFEVWQASRAAALEEAAEICDEKWSMAPRGSVICAAAIRALKEQS